MSTVLDQIPIIDADTHVVEPPDLWTSRMSPKYGDKIPQVKFDPDFGDEAWFIGDRRIFPVGSSAMAGWAEYPPDHPKLWSETDPVSWDAKLRAKRMDEYGIRSQVLYPNVAMFSSAELQKVADADLQLEYVRAYNDFQTDFANEAPGRFIPMSAIPFWDLQATLAEIERCVVMGHRGIVFSQNPTAFGLPGLTDRHWDPMWASAQEKGLPVNFHIASGGLDLGVLERSHYPENGAHASYAAMGVTDYMANARTIAYLVTGGICHRFPELNFVSVESGVGWIPFALAALDWQWLNCGVPKEHPEYDLLPSEYFARQIYGCFWFERDTALTTIEALGADNILYETDFPHPTSMSPGPATSAIAPNEYLEQVFSGLPEADLRKILHDNAARIYHLD